MSDPKILLDRVAEHLSIWRALWTGQLRLRFDLAGNIVATVARACRGNRWPTMPEAYIGLQPALALCASVELRRTVLRIPVLAHDHSGFYELMQAWRLACVPLLGTPRHGRFELAGRPISAFNVMLLTLPFLFDCAASAFSDGRTRSEWHWCLRQTRFSGRDGKPLEQNRLTGLSSYRRAGWKNGAGQLRRMIRIAIDLKRRIGGQIPETIEDPGSLESAVRILDRLVEITLRESPTAFRPISDPYADRPPETFAKGLRCIFPRLQIGITISRRSTGSANTNVQCDAHHRPAPPANARNETDAPAIESKAFLTGPDLVDLLGVKVEKYAAFMKRLERFRPDNQQAWREDTNAPANAARFTYRVNDVRHLADGLL